jgi:hypothetical protein
MADVADVIVVGGGNAAFCAALAAQALWPVASATASAVSPPVRAAAVAKTIMVLRNIGCTPDPGGDRRCRRRAAKFCMGQKVGPQGVHLGRRGYAVLRHGERMLVSCQNSRIRGLECFAGKSLHSAQWPQEDVSFAEQRVGVIGTGSSGIQIIPEVAQEAGHLYRDHHRGSLWRNAETTVPANGSPCGGCRNVAP